MKKNSYYYYYYYFFINYAIIIINNITIINAINDVSVNDLYIIMNNIKNLD